MIVDITNLKSNKFDLKLYAEIHNLIESSRFKVAQTINLNITLLYWNVGHELNEKVLQNKRAKYGKEIIMVLSEKLVEEFGNGWSVKQLRHCLRFAETFPKLEIVSSLGRQLSWTHFKTFMYIKED